MWLVTLSSLPVFKFAWIAFSLLYWTDQVDMTVPETCDPSIKVYQETQKSGLNNIVPLDSIFYLKYNFLLY